MLCGRGEAEAIKRTVSTERLVLLVSCYDLVNNAFFSNSENKYITRRTPYYRENDSSVLEILIASYWSGS